MNVITYTLHLAFKAERLIVLGLPIGQGLLLTKGWSDRAPGIHLLYEPGFLKT